jgi:predicted DNA-binding antitoxin AbrB/MazE fold protein
MESRSTRGVIHGKTIELTEDLGINEGQEVEVVVRVRPSRPDWGQGIIRSAGAMAHLWTEEDDRILEEIERERGRDSTREIPE